MLKPSIDFRLSRIELESQTLRRFPGTGGPNGYSLFEGRSQNLNFKSPFNLLGGTNKRSCAPLSTQGNKFPQYNPPYGWLLLRTSQKTAQWFYIDEGGMRPTAFCSRRMRPLYMAASLSTRFGHCFPFRFVRFLTGASNLMKKNYQQINTPPAKQTGHLHLNRKTNNSNRLIAIKS